MVNFFNQDENVNPPPGYTNLGAGTGYVHMVRQIPNPNLFLCLPKSSPRTLIRDLIPCVKNKKPKPELGPEP